MFFFTGQLTKKTKNAGLLSETRRPQTGPDGIILPLDSQQQLDYERFIVQSILDGLKLKINSNVFILACFYVIFFRPKNLCRDRVCPCVLLFFANSWTGRLTVWFFVPTGGCRGAALTKRTLHFQTLQALSGASDVFLKLGFGLLEYKVWRKPVKNCKASLRTTDSLIPTPVKMRWQICSIWRSRTPAVPFGLKGRAMVTLAKLLAGDFFGCGLRGL